MKTNLFKEGAATPSKKDRFDKKKVNVKVNPVINFQIGLIAALLLAFVVIELTTQTVEPERVVVSNTDIADPDWTNPTFRIVPNKPKPEVVIKPNKELPPVVVPDDTPDPDPIPEEKPIEPVDKSSDNTPVDDSPIESAPVKTKKPAPKTSITTTMDGVDSMPLYPGCESLDNNVDRRKCFNDKMQRFVQRKFNKGLADELNLDDGEIVKIDILFTINEKGLPIDVKVKAPHAILEKEAYRLIGKLPKITPGKINGDPVSVYFHLPIRFKMNR
ncbi:energy transducer TonB [Nonlabens ulvanivorans]|uniref:energy transducer TonB n=1 Tax=Nonlabens ulvanivorans TaxID=906888 RepID=UPI00326407F2